MRCGTDHRTDYFIPKAIQRNVGPEPSKKHKQRTEPHAKTT